MKTKIFKLGKEWYVYWPGIGYAKYHGFKTWEEAVAVAKAGPVKCLTSTGRFRSP